MWLDFTVDIVFTQLMKALHGQTTQKLCHKLIILSRIKRTLDVVVIKLLVSSTIFGFVNEVVLDNILAP